jgi:tRNA nucleotidyltransferase (CCA-adding enzyme)
MVFAKTEKNLQTYWQKISRLPDFLFIKQLRSEFPESKIYLVGGAVRDIILKREPIEDWDFVVREVQPKKLKENLSHFGTVNLVGKKFGVFKFKAKTGELKKSLDLALPRTEVPTGKKGGHKDFKIETNAHLHIEADLARRDFTINAMAYSIFEKQLIDPYNGLSDLRKKKLDTVGIPKRRFSEDISRILRAIRFSCELNLEIEPRVWKNIKTLSKKINSKTKKDWIVPREVLAKELLKSFKADPQKAFDLYDISGLTNMLFPELLKMKKCPQPKNYHTEGDVWKHTRLALEKLGSMQYKKLFPGKNPNVLTIMAVLFHDVGKPYTIQTPQKHGTDRIRFNNHDNVGGAIAYNACKRLKLSSWEEGKVDCEKLGWLGKKHLLLVHGNPEEIRNNTLEKYFLNKENPGNELLELFFADGAATILATGKADISPLKKLFKRLDILNKTLKKTGLKTIISGHDVMNTFKIKQGPEIGKLLSLIREAQLAGTLKTKKEALSYLQKHLL